MTATHAGSITVRRTIEASAEEIFDAWLDAESLAAWMQPRATLRTTARNDARIGGSFEVVMHMPTEQIVHRGTYQELERPRRLVFTWISPATEQRESLVSVELHPRGNATEVVVTHERLPERETASHTEGWTDALALLASMLGRKE
jgi:uncharacterized protein YndB with AHSA1/START domain